MENLTQEQKVDAVLEFLPGLAKAMAGAAQWLLCRDQEKQLSESVQQVLNLADRELALAVMSFRMHSEAASHRELIGLMINGATVLLGGRVTPRADSTPPRLGKVLIAVGPEGIPVDLSVVNIFELADSEGKPDILVEKTFADKGYVLFTIENFKDLASWLQQEVLSGGASLPYHPAPNSSPVGS